MMSRSSFRKLPILIAAAVLLLVGALHTIAPRVASAHAASAKPNVRSTLAGIHPISVAYEKQFILKHMGARGAYLVAHMQHRWEALPAPASQIAPNTKTTTTTDPSWSGYVSDLYGSGYVASRVFGTFHSIKYNGCNRGGTCPSLGTWIGMGGYYATSNLLQLGYDQSSGDAFWEWENANGDNGLTEMFAIPSGDFTEGEIMWDSSTGYWFLMVSDLDTGNYGPGYEVNYTPDTTTVEWIDEDVFGADLSNNTPTITFGDATWENNHNTTDRAINDAEVPVVRILRAKESSRCLKPGALSSNGQGFTISWTSTVNC